MSRRHPPARRRAAVRGDRPGPVGVGDDGEPAPVTTAVPLDLTPSIIACQASTFQLTANSTREATLIFWKTFLRWKATVCWEMNSCLPTSLLV